MADQAAALPALDDTMGVLFIGAVLAMALWGAGTVQVYLYYNRYPKDELWMKTLVALVWALDTAHQGLIIHVVYTYLVTEYGNPAFLAVNVNTLMIEVVVSALVVAFVQAFFILRIWKLSHGNIAAVVILSICAAAPLILQIIYTHRGLGYDTFAELQKNFDLSRAVNITSAISDVAIAMTLIFLLQRSRTGFKRSDGIINRLILFSLNTGLLTGLDAVASLIANIVWSDTFIYILFFFNISRLYTNSLMATLNSRKGLKGVDESGAEESVVLSQGRYRSRAVEIEAPTIVKGNNQPRTLSIKVNTETETVRDQEEGLKHGHGTPSESLSDVPYHYGDSKPHAYLAQ